MYEVISGGRDPPEYWQSHQGPGSGIGHGEPCCCERGQAYTPPKKHYRPCFSDSIRKHKVWSWEIDWMWASVYLHVWLMLRLPCLINVILILRLAFQKLLIQIQKFFFQMTNILEFPIAFQVHIGLYLRCWKKYPAQYRS